MGMQLQLGRLIDHVHLRARHLETTKVFYRAVLGVLGLALTGDDAHHLACDELWIDPLGEDQTQATHVHLAFQARDRATVERFHAAGLEAGGRDNGAPGERAYHPGYYGAFLLDPDGNNIEAVFHGPAARSAPSVTIAF
jgi:catechol 2,3-dioxygenase-like lactoylglutathione lyase family enzyme